MPAVPCPVTCRPRARRGPPAPAALLSALALVASLPGCRVLPAPRRVDPVPQAASVAFEEARTWARATSLGTSVVGGGAPRAQGGGVPEPLAGVTDPARARERARAAALRALELAPDWVAPRRMLDDLARADLLGLEALEERRAALAARPADAGLTYLVGRLEGERGRWRFERAVALDPDLAWGHHGLAWAASLDGDARSALRHGRRALERARDPFERSFFTAALARYHAAADGAQQALELLETCLAEAQLAPIDRVELSVQAAQIELGLVFRPEYDRGWQRALGLLREHDLTEGEVEALANRMRLFRSGDGTLELQLALGARKSPMRDRLRAELMLESRPTPLALGLLRRSRATRDSPLSSGLLLRNARFAAGQFTIAVEEWLRDVPSSVRGADGLPRDEALRRVVEEARRLAPDPDQTALASLGERLLAAGWFLEARSVASALAAHDLDVALDLEDRAAAGQELLLGLRRLMQTLDERARGGAGLTSIAGPGQPAAATSDAERSPRVKGLSGLFEAMAPLVARAQTLLGGEPDSERVAARLQASPLVHYGPVGSVVHPGPWFSAADQAQGMGTRGEPVPGLAELFARLGRFALFGELAGQPGPDGTILQRVHVEERAGAHLGVPWSGTVAVCEGADLLSRAGRRGASLSGAALHEGYWIDFDALRRQRDTWAAFEREYGEPEAAGRLERALATRGLALTAPVHAEGARRRERRDVDTLLGQADRVRLAVLRDRLRERPEARLASGSERGPAAGEGLVPLDELVHVTELHEQAHLCDRTRFLPVGANLGAALRLLLASGLSPSGVARRLEYRAELTALCEAEDPRVVLVGVLDAVEGGGNGVTPHAAGYRDLLFDLVGVLDRDRAAHPERWPELDDEHVLVHQLHRLGPERLREAALMLARRWGLVERG